MGEKTTTSCPRFLILPGDLLSRGEGGGVMLLLLLHSSTCKWRDFLLVNILHSITVHDLLHWEIRQRFAHHRPLSFYIPDGANLILIKQNITLHFKSGYFSCQVWRQASKYRNRKETSCFFITGVRATSQSSYSYKTVLQLNWNIYYLKKLYMQLQYIIVSVNLNHLTYLKAQHDPAAPRTNNKIIK